MRSDTPLPESCKLFLQVGSLYFHVTLFWSAGLGTRFLWEFQCCAFKDGTQESEGELWWVWALMRNFCRALGLKDSLKRTGIATHPKWMWKAREPFLSVYTHNFKTDTSLRAEARSSSHFHAQLQPFAKSNMKQRPVDPLGLLVLLQRKGLFKLNSKGNIFHRTEMGNPRKDGVSNLVTHKAVEKPKYFQYNGIQALAVILICRLKKWLWPACVRVCVQAWISVPGSTGTSSSLLELSSGCTKYSSLCFHTRCVGPALSHLRKTPSCHSLTCQLQNSG